MTATSFDQFVTAQGTASDDILVVDDNAANLIAMEAALGQVGGRIVPAHSGEEALRILLERDFALILLDVQMPTLGGFETARLIRERQRSRHTPIIFVTAYGREEDVRAAYELGAVDFLFKPVIAEILRSKVSVFVELQRRSAQLASQSEQLRAHERREHERTLEEERRRWNEEAMRRQMAEMAEADRRKDEFLAVLGHELRNPLSAIVVGCELLLRKMKGTPGIDEAILRTRDRIDRQAQHLRRLVDDLLDLSRINSGKVELRKVETSIQHIIDQAVQTSVPQVEEHKHTLTVDVPAETLSLFADPDRLIQVVGNLLNNAIRYTPDGGHIQISCVAQPAAGNLQIRVSDDGRGISAELLPRVFDIFVQEHGNGASSGLGLGLTIVKRLVSLHNGSVTAASDGVGRGSTFTLTLPLGKDAMTDKAAAVAAPGGGVGVDGRAGGRLVVLVEDNMDIREPMQELLRDLGHRVEAASDGGSGVELIVSLKPDVAIVDVGLPVMNGYQVAERVRARLGSERPRLVAMTGFGQDSDRSRARQAGFDAHLVKPADIEAIGRVLSDEPGGAEGAVDAEDARES